MRWRLCALLLAALLVLASGFAVGTVAAFSARTTNSATVANAILAAPGNVSAAVQSNGGTVHVTWSATASTWATGHRVYRATASGGPYSQIAQFANRTTLSYDDVPGTSIYYYRVAAYYTASGANWESQGNGQAGPIKPLASFTFASIGPQILNSAFSITITARASDGSVVTAFTGTVSLSVSPGTLTPSTSGAFTAGVRTQTVTISGSISLGAVITATGGSPSRSGNSLPFVVAVLSGPQPLGHIDTSPSSPSSFLCQIPAYAWSAPRPQRG